MRTISLAELSSTVYPRLNWLKENELSPSIARLYFWQSHLQDRTRTTGGHRETCPRPDPGVPTTHDSGDSGVRRGHTQSLTGGGELLPMPMISCHHAHVLTWPRGALGF